MKKNYAWHDCSKIGKSETPCICPRSDRSHPLQRHDHLPAGPIFQAMGFRHLWHEARRFYRAAHAVQSVCTLGVRERYIPDKVELFSLVLATVVTLELDIVKPSVVYSRHSLATLSTMAVS